jgi:hypothetical protein
LELDSGGIVGLGKKVGNGMESDELEMVARVNGTAGTGIFSTREWPVWRQKAGDQQEIFLRPTEPEPNGADSMEPSRAAGQVRPGTEVH